MPDANKLYLDYLKSKKFEVIRQLVFRRASGLCEGCRSRPPRQIHHLTYIRLGDEMLMDLVALYAFTGRG
jgi:hypothetical protein